MVNAVDNEFVEALGEAEDWQDLCHAAGSIDTDWEARQFLRVIDELGYKVVRK